MTPDRVIVDDGQACWIADRHALIPALAQEGWEKDRMEGSRIYREPDPRDPDDPFETPYARLCAIVPAIERHPDELAISGLPHFTYRPDWDAWEWTA